MATYKIGDKVKVRGDLSREHGAGGEMYKLAGKVVTISEVAPMTLFGKFPDTYHIEEDESPCKYIWADEMFEGLADEQEAPAETKRTEMPKLTTGMFGKESDGDLFVVVGDNIVYQRGMQEDVDDTTWYHNIVALYDCKCFRQIEDGRAKVIWERK